MLNRVLKDKLYCGLDIGANKLKVGLVQLKDGEPEILGAYEHPVHGFKDSCVHDLNQFSECIHQVMTELAAKTGVHVKDIEVGLDGNLVKIRKTSAAIPLVDRGNKVIAAGDVRKLNKQARLLGVKMEEEVLHEMPQTYLIDDINAAANPVGLYGRKLAVQSLMVVSDVDKAKNIIKSINHAGYEVRHIFFGSYACSHLLLTPDQRRNGCVLIDIGATVTSILVFHEGIIKYVHAIPIGGQQLTKDIALRLKLNFELAEEIKRSYATAVSSQIQEEEVLVKRDNAYIPIKHGEIYQAISDRLDSLIGQIDDSIRASNLYEYVGSGIRITGGGALLPGLIERIEEKTRLEVSLAQIQQLTPRNVSNAAVFATAVSCAHRGWQFQDQGQMTAQQHVDWGRRLINKVKELYFEYF